MIWRILGLLAVITLIVVAVSAGLSMVITLIILRMSMKEFLELWKQEDESWKN